MTKTAQHSIKNPLDTLFNAFINDKINKNILPYNGIYNRIQGYRQAQKEKPCTCINKLKRLHYSPISHVLEQNKHYKNISKKNKKYAQKSRIHNRNPYRFIHTYSELNLILIPASR